jgi:hypothetical protein
MNFGWCIFKFRLDGSRPSALLRVSSGAGHASSHFTLQVYSQAQTRTKRAAQARLVEAILPEETGVPADPDRGGRTNEALNQSVSEVEQDGARRERQFRAKLLKGLVGTAGFEPTTSTV